MALIHPQGSLLYLGQRHDGMAVQHGLSRDWRFGKSTWALRGLEYIEPLRAIGPWGLKLPTDMDLDVWTLAYNDKFREWKAIGNPSAVGALFYDGAVYAAATAITTFCGTATSPIVTTGLPQWVLNITQYAPPPTQGVIPQASVAMKAQYRTAISTDPEVEDTWENAQVGLCLPHHSETYNRSFLWCHVGATAWTDNVNWLNDGNAGFPLGLGPSSHSMSQKPTEETWVFETVEVWRDANGALWGESGEGRTFVTTHILIRRGSEFDDWWHITDSNLRFVTEGSPYWRVTMGGSVQWFNLSAVRYSWEPVTAGAYLPWDGAPLTGGTVPDVTGPTPNGKQPPGDPDAWNSDPAYSAIASNVSGWTVAVVNHPTLADRPYLTCTPADYVRYYRPVVWSIGETNQAIIGEVDALTSHSTEGDSSLVRLSLTLNKDWKGASGSGEFLLSLDAAARYDTWKVNAKLDVTMGWQTGAGAGLAATKMAEAYIKPDGIRRWIDGDDNGAAPMLAVEFGDFAEVRAARKGIADLRQAGGMTVDDWAHMIANRMGIATGETGLGDLLYVDPAVADLVITETTDIPSLATLAPHDGETYLSHIAAVEKAADIRVGFSRQVSGTWYVMTVDAGPAEFVPATGTPPAGGSTIALSIDYDTTTFTALPWSVENQPNGDRYRNVLKARYGRPKRTVTGVDAEQSTWYWSETLERRKETIGDDWGTTIEDSDSDTQAGPWEQFLEECYGNWGRLRWTMTMRTDVLPDSFVEITDLPGIETDDGFIYQVQEVTYEIDADPNVNDATMDVTAVLVYLPIGIYGASRYGWATYGTGSGDYGTARYDIATYA